MTIIALCKVLLLGCGGALGYYFFVSYVFLHFPMPFFLGASTLLEGQILQREVAQKKSQHFWWRFGKGVLNGLLVLVWWMVFGGFAYLLYFALDFYFPEAGLCFGRILELRWRCLRFGSWCVRCYFLEKSLLKS